MATEDRNSDSRTALITAARAGSVTLVLGAGVSIEAGVPNWRGLAVRVWQQALKTPGATSPIDKLDIEKVVQDPQLFPVIFELAEERLGQQAFIEVLRDCIYQTARPLSAIGASGTLEAVAEVISRDYLLGARRRIVRVVTFNADELLREALRAQRRAHNLEQFWQTMDHAVSGIPAGRGSQPVPIYHVHGFLPRAGGFGFEFSEHRLVFTDSQYWESGTSQASLANRTMNAALADSHCLFVGLSMTDANVLRWLAIRHNEIARDIAHRVHRSQALSPEAAPASTDAESRERPRDVRQRRLTGHFWIRAPGDDRTGILSAFLRLRGVDAVEITGWQDGSFVGLLEECFPRDGNVRGARRPGTGLPKGRGPRRRR